MACCRAPGAFPSSSHAHGLAQGVPQQIIGVFDPTGASPRTTVECRPQLPHAKGAACRPDFQGTLQETAVHLLHDQAFANRHQRAFAEGRGAAIEAIEHHLPATIPRRGFTDLIIGHTGIRLQDRRQRQLGGGNRRMACGGDPSTGLPVPAATG
jgi:hypothetical protein